MNMFQTLLTLIAILLFYCTLGKVFDSQRNNRDIYRKDLRRMQCAKEKLWIDQAIFFTNHLKSETRDSSTFEQLPVPNDGPASIIEQLSVPHDGRASTIKQLSVPNDGPVHFNQLSVPTTAPQAFSTMAATTNVTKNPVPPTATAKKNTNQA